MSASILSPSARRHALGLALSAATAVVLVIVFLYGRPFLDGTGFEDLFYLVYFVVVVAVLTLVDRLAGRLLPSGVET